MEEMSCRGPRTLFEANDCSGRYMFNVGAPDESLLHKVALLMSNATKTRLEHEMDSESSLLQYGAPAGDPRYLAALQQFLTTEYGQHVDQSSLVQTAGASSGLYYILTQLFPRRCTVYCEQYSFFIALSTMRQLHFTLQPVGLERDGVNVEELETLWRSELSESCEDVHEFSAMLFLIPSYHNPTGSVLSPEKSAALVKLARKYNVLIFCDDVYNLLTYDSSTPPQRLFAYDKTSDVDYKGNVVSNGSFAKLLSPGLRLGWMELPHWLKHKYWDKSPVIDSGGGLSQYVGGIVAVALEDGSASRHLDDTRQEMAERQRIMLEELDMSLPEGCQLFTVPKGGYFAFLKLPPMVSSTELHVMTTEKYGLRFQEGWKFYSGDNGKEKADNCLRLSWAHVDKDAIRPGIQLLCQTIGEMLH